MHTTKIIIFALFVSFVVSFVQPKQKVAFEELLQESLSTPRVLSRNQNPPVEPMSFSWADCGPATAPIHLSILKIVPDPIILGDNITIFADGSTKVDFTPQIGVSVSLVIETKVFGYWVKVPCVDNIGSCTYSDPCALMANDVHLCPTITPYGLPCKCPIKANSYGTPTKGIVAHTRNPGYSWLTSGDYRVTATLNGPASSVLGCIQVTASLGPSRVEN